MKTIRPTSISSLIPQPLTQQTRFTCRALATSYRPVPSPRPERPHVRSFFGAAAGSANPFGSNQTLTAQRTLSYPSNVVYGIISDVASYSQFVPFCQESIVTKYSAPAHDGHEYPEEAKLVIGFNDSIREAFTSRVYCVPGRIVEAVSGNMKTTLAGDEIAHHSPRPAAADDPSRNDTVMAHLLTRWTLRPYPYKPPPVTAAYPETAHRNVHETSDVPGQHKTEVSLAIEFQFSNPLYAALSSAAAPKIADKMIRAFEQRVKEVMEGPGHARDKTYTRKY